MQINNFKKVGEKNSQTILVRVSKSQKQRLQILAESSGYKSLSDYVRVNLLNPLEIVESIKYDINR